MAVESQESKWKTRKTSACSEPYLSGLSKNLVERVFKCLKLDVVTEQQIQQFLNITDNKEEMELKDCLDELKENGKIKVKTFKCEDKAINLYWLPALSQDKTAISIPSPGISPSPITTGSALDVSVHSERHGQAVNSTFQSPLVKKRSPVTSSQYIPGTPKKRLKIDTNCSPVENSPHTDDPSSKTIRDLHHTGRLVDEKYRLMKELENKKELLRKLNLVKMHRAKNNLETMQRLIDKWRVVSQQAAQRLFDSSSGSKPTSMGELLDFFNIDHKLIQYSDEDETFY